MREDQLIARMRELLPVGERTLVGSGDDCAEIATPTGSFLISTDVLVENVHFRLDWSTPFQIGARAAAQNLADIMGQGGVPTALVVSLVIPPYLSADWLCELVAGFASRVSGTEAGVVGGDLSRGEQLVISVTVCGEPATSHGSILRSTAQPGDIVAVAGTLGFSYAGFLLLQQFGRQATELFPEGAGERCFIDTFLAPNPPLEAAPLAAYAGATAMMDISDGLSTDLARIAQASKVTLELSSELLTPFTKPLITVAPVVGKTPLELVLDGGEDHALLACFPVNVQLPAVFHPIGVVAAECSSSVAVTTEGVTLDGKPLSVGGWDHFKQ